MERMSAENWIRTVSLLILTLQFMACSGFIQVFLWNLISINFYLEYCLFYFTKFHKLCDSLCQYLPIPRYLHSYTWWPLCKWMGVMTFKPFTTLLYINIVPPHLRICGINILIQRGKQYTTELLNLVRNVHCYWHSCDPLNQISILIPSS